MIAIFKKDVAHLWPKVLIFVATLVLFACEDPAYVPRYGNGVQWFSLLLPPLACWLLVTSLMQAEKMVGHNQYWLTRPLSRGGLLGAKVLFLLVFVILPVYACQLVVLKANDYSPWEYASPLLAKQFFFTAWIVLPIAAVATVTKSLGHAFLAGLLVAAGMLLCIVLLADKVTPSGWGGLLGPGRVRTRHPVAYIQRSFDLGPLRLADAIVQ